MELDLENISVGSAVLPKYKIRTESIDSDDQKAFVKSIEENGILQSILVRRTIGNKFEVVSGVRRYQAVKELGLKTIPALVSEHMNDTEMVTCRLIENVCRKDLTIIERGKAFIAAYEKSGYSTKQASAYLEILHHRYNKASTDRVPEKFKLIANKLGLSPQMQRRYIQLIEHGSESPEILEKIDEYGLNMNKAELVFDERIAEEKDKDIKKFVQHKMLEKIKYEPLTSSKIIRDQEIHNLKGTKGKVYKKDPVSNEVIYNPHNVDHIPVPKEALEHAKESKYLSTIFDLEGSMSDILKALTGIEDHDHNERVVANTKAYRLELFKKIEKRDAIRIYNHLFAVKAAVDDTMELLDKEIDVKEKKDKILTT